jgi:hypothetical protein
MIITKKHLSRRTVLRGMGATVALPLLESMLPAQTPSRQTEAIRSTRSRLCCIEVVHGAAGSNTYGAEKNLWSPAPPARISISLNSTALLEPLREYLTIVSGLMRDGRSVRAGRGQADHFRTAAVYLTQAKPKMTEGSDVRRHLVRSATRIFL